MKQSGLTGFIPLYNSSCVIIIEYIDCPWLSSSASSLTCWGARAFIGNITNGAIVIAKDSHLAPSLNASHGKVGRTSLTATSIFPLFLKMPFYTLAKMTRTPKSKAVSKILKVNAVPRKWNKDARQYLISTVNRCLEKLLQSTQQVCETSKNISKTHVLATMALLQVPGNLVEATMQRLQTGKAPTFAKPVAIRRRLKKRFPENQIKSQTVQFTAQLLDLVSDNLITTSRDMCNKRKCKIVMPNDVQQASRENDAICALLQRNICDDSFAPVLTKRTGNSYSLANSA